MIKPIAEIHHKPGKRSIVYADDYNRLLKYCDQLQAEKVALADRIGMTQSDRAREAASKVLRNKDSSKAEKTKNGSALTRRIVKKPHKKGSIPIDVIKQAVKNARNARDNG